MIINRENMLIYGLDLPDEFVKNNEGFVYLGTTHDAAGVVTGHVSIALEDVLTRRRLPPGSRPNNGMERFDHIVDSEEIGVEAVKRGLMTAAEAKIKT